MASRGMSVFTAQGTEYTVNDPNNADEFSASAAYSRNAYVYYQGDLYRFAVDHPAGSWNASHVVKVLLGDEIRQFQGQVLNMNKQYLDPATARSGYYWNNDGTKSASESFYAFDPFYVPPGVYYVRGYHPTFSYFRDASNNYIKVNDNASIFDVFTTQTGGWFYITTNDSIGVNNGIVSNIDIRAGNNIPYGGTSLVDVDQINRLIAVDYPEQFVDPATKVEGKYWSDIGVRGNADDWATYGPLPIKAGEYYGEGIYDVWSWFKGSGAGVKLRNMPKRNGHYYFTEDGFVYISTKPGDIKKDPVLANFVYPSNMATKIGKFPSVAPAYAAVTDFEKHTYINDNSYGASGPGASKSGNVITVTGNDAGASTPDFTSTSNRLEITYDYSFTGTENVRFYIRRYNSQSQSTYEKKIDSLNPGSVSGVFIIDAAADAVYADTVAYQILIWSGPGTTITINNLQVRELTELEVSKYYREKLDDMLLSLANGVEKAEADAQTKTTRLVTKSVDGKKYGVQMGASGQLVTFPYIPNKVIFMGNSITCGMADPLLGNFGMASTMYQRDWVYYVDGKIKEKNPSATYTRMYSSPFEHSETLEAAEAWIVENESAFTADTDLVLIEMGDNVNTDTKRTVFTSSFPELIESIRTHSEKARIIMIGIWFNNPTKNIIISNCQKYGIEFVDISGLHTTANEAVVGDTIYYSDGTTGTISASIATHPGDNGMIAIGQAVIDTMDM